MGIALGNLQDQFQQAYQWAGGKAGVIRNEISAELGKAKQAVIHGTQVVQLKLLEAANKTQEFVLRHKETIFFFGCACVTAYFAPQLFFPVLVATIIIRVELTYYLKKLANEYLKPEKNMYIQTPFFGPNYISTLDVTMAAIAAVDAIALGTIFVANSWTVAIIPALGGLAAGSCVAKWGMDMAQAANVALV